MFSFVLLAKRSQHVIFPEALQDVSELERVLISYDSVSSSPLVSVIAITCSLWPCVCMCADDSIVMSGSAAKL